MLFSERKRELWCSGRDSDPGLRLERPAASYGYAPVLLGLGFSAEGAYSHVVVDGAEFGVSVASWNT